MSAREYSFLISCCGRPHLGQLRAAGLWGVQETPVPPFPQRDHCTPQVLYLHPCNPQFKLVQSLQENKLIPHSKAALLKFWHPLVMEEDSPLYKAKTKERGPEDRERSVFFTHLANGETNLLCLLCSPNHEPKESDEYREFLQRECELHEKREQWKRQRNEKEKRKQDIKAARITGQRGASQKRAAGNTASSTSTNSGKNQTKPGAGKANAPATKNTNRKGGKRT